MVPPRRTPYRAYYGLRQIKALVCSGDYFVTKGARGFAKKDFGWTLDDIKKAMCRLQPKHFYKSAEHWDNPSIYVDYYKAYGLMGENVYTHFRIDDGKLIIDSFKEI